MLRILNELNLKRIFLLAILIRLLLMPFYFHPDIKTYNYQSSYLKNGVFNIYTYLADHKNELPIREDFVYFPLTYFSLGLYQMVAAPLLGNNFQEWLSNAQAGAVNKPGVFRYLFILKLPYLILDLLVPFLIIKFLKNRSQQRNAFILWLFNPFSLAIIYIFSNVDIIPVIISLLSILLFQKRRIFLSAILLGLAIGFKPYPILFLPFLLLFIKDFKKIILMSVTILAVVLTIIVPFFSPAFLHSALVSNLTTRIAFPGIEIGFGEGLMIGVISLMVLLLAVAVKEKKKLEHVWYYLFAALLLMFSTVHFHIQWLLWIMPFLVLFHFFNVKLAKFVWIWISLSFLIPVLYDDRSMSISLISTISSLYNLLPTPFLIVSHFYDALLLQGIIHSIIFAISILVAISIVVIGKSFRLSGK